MSNARKAKGTRWESAVEAYALERGVSAYKPRQAGFADLGDVHAFPFVLQAKDWRSWQDAIREGLDGAVKQAANVNARPTGGGLWIPAAAVKRARRPVGEAFAVLRLEDLFRLRLRDDV